MVPIYDMQVKENDLVVGTHGRSFWILDDLTPLYQIAGEQEQPQAKLFKPNVAYRQPPDLTHAWFEGEGKEYHIGLGAPTIYDQMKTEVGLTERTFLDSGKSAPNGVIVYYTLPQKPDGQTDISLTFLDSQGAAIRQFKPKPPKSKDKKEKQEPNSEDEGPWIPAEAGANRFVWDLRYENAHKVPQDKTVSKTDLKGPLVVPGTYQVQLQVGQQTFSQTFEVLKDPRVSASQADFEAQLELLLKIRDRLSETHDTVTAIRNVRRQVEALEARLKHLDRSNIEEISKAAESLKEKLHAIEDRLIIPAEDYVPARIFDQPARLNVKLAGLVSVVSSADAAPTQQSVEVFEQVAAQVDRQVAAWQQLLATDVAAFNQLVHESNIPTIVPPSFID